MYGAGLQKMLHCSIFSVHLYYITFVFAIGPIDSSFIKNWLTGKPWENIWGPATVVEPTGEGYHREGVCSPPVVGGVWNSAASAAVLYEDDTATVLCPSGLICLGLCSSTCLPNGTWHGTNTNMLTNGIYWLGTCIPYDCSNNGTVCPDDYRCVNGSCVRQCQSQRICYGYEVCIEGQCSDWKVYKKAIEHKWEGVSKLHYMKCNFDQYESSGPENGSNILDAERLAYTTPALLVRYVIEPPDNAVEAMVDICANQCYQYSNCTVAAYNNNHQRCEFYGQYATDVILTDTIDISTTSTTFVTNITNCTSFQIAEHFELDLIVNTNKMVTVRDVHTVQDCRHLCQIASDCLAFWYEKSSLFGITTLTYCHLLNTVPARISNTTTDSTIGITSDKRKYSGPYPTVDFIFENDLNEL